MKAMSRNPSSPSVTLASRTRKVPAGLAAMKSCPAFTAPKLDAVAAVQVKESASKPSPLSWSETVLGSVPDCETPMSVLVNPAAGPPTALKLPS